MRISKQNLTIDQADDSEDAFRPVLATIKFEREGSVSADGIRLAFVPYPEPCAEDDPAVNTLVPIDVARRVAAVARWSDVIDLARDGDRFTITVRQKLDEGDETESVDLALSADVAKPGVDFPKWRNLVPPEKAITATAILNPEYLIDACEQLRVAGYSSVHLKLPGDTKQPVIVEGHEYGAEPGPFVLLMPMKQIKPGEHLRDVSGGKAAG